MLGISKFGQGVVFYGEIPRIGRIGFKLMVHGSCRGLYNFGTEWEVSWVVCSIFWSEFGGPLASSMFAGITRAFKVYREK